MICLKCGANNLYRERSGRKCSKCGHVFVFEPKLDNLTDKFFLKALELVSAKESLSYHPQHLYYELARLRNKKPTVVKSKLGNTLGTLFLFCLVLPFWSMFLVSLLSFTMIFWILEAVYLLTAGIVCVRVWKNTDPAVIGLSYDKFKPLLDKWRKVNGLPKGLLDKKLSLPVHVSETDLLDYSVDRAIICDKPELVDFLLANNFHIEQKCAVLSYGGHPKERFEDIRQMLKRNPNVCVFVLHNASLNGCRIYASIKNDKDWFKGFERIYDIGLNPSHAKAFAGLWQTVKESHVQAIPGYSEQDMKWLSQYKLELMAVRPEHLLNRLRNVLNGYTKNLADAYARGDSDSGFGGADIMIIGSDFDLGADDDFG